MSTEKFCLRWNDFEKNISSAFSELRDDQDFFDVTIACDDEQLQAHKIILSACSPLFRNILRRNKHQHPLLYLKGVKYTDFQSVLNFMYHGEANIAQEQLNSFLAVAEDLKIKGLTQNKAEASKKHGKEVFEAKQVPHSTPSSSLHTSTARIPQKEIIKRNFTDNTIDSFSPGVQDDDDIQEVQVPIKSEPIQQQGPSYQSNQPIAIQEQLDDNQIDTYHDDSNIYDEYGQYGDDQYVSTLDTSLAGQSYDTGKGSEPDRSILLENIQKGFTVEGKSCFTCSLCGKSNSQKSNLLKHVESVHFPTLFEYSCKFCGKSFGAKNNLYVHISTYHRDAKKY